MPLGWFIFIQAQTYLIQWLLMAAFFNGKIFVKTRIRFRRLQRMKKQGFCIHILQAMQTSLVITRVFAALMVHCSLRVEKEVHGGFLFPNIRELNLIYTKVLVKRSKAAKHNLFQA